MAYGLEIQNSDGKDVISSNWDLLKFGGKGTTIQSGLHSWFVGGIINFYAYYSIIDFTMPDSSEPIIFYSFPLNQSGTLVKLARVSGNNWRVEFRGSSNSVPTVYFFYHPSILSPSSETHGMRIYGADSSLIYDSGWDYSSILHIADLPSITCTIGQTTTSSGSIVKPAILWQSPYRRILDTTLRDFAYGLGLKRTSTTSWTVVEEDLEHVYQGNTDGPDFTLGDGRTLVVPMIDAANYD